MDQSNKHVRKTPSGTYYTQFGRVVQVDVRFSLPLNKEAVYYQLQETHVEKIVGMLKKESTNCLVIPFFGNLAWGVNTNLITLFKNTFSHGKLIVMTVPGDVTGKSVKGYVRTFWQGDYELVESELVIEVMKEAHGSKLYTESFERIVTDPANQEWVQMLMSGTMPICGGECMS